MLNPLDLAGRHFLVTGASSGIGRETAILISQLGGRVTLTGRNHARLLDTLHAMNGREHRADPFDLNSGNDLVAWMKDVTVNAPLNGLVHAAGIHAMRPLRLAEPAMLDEMMRTNFHSAVMLARAFRQKACIAPDGGSIVFISSVAGLVGEGAVSAYSASKAAILGLTRSLAMELASERIRVNAIAPGFVKSEMSDRLLESLPPDHAKAIETKHPLGTGVPRDVANSAVFLLANTARWITGTTLVVDGGYTAH